MHQRSVSVTRKKRVFVLLEKVQCWKVQALLLQFPFARGRRGLRGILVLNQQACVVCRSGHPAESMSLITTMLRIYSELTPLTPKSLFPPLGLLGLFILLNSLHKALVTSTVRWKLNWGWEEGEWKRSENSQTLILHLKES